MPPTETVQSPALMSTAWALCKLAMAIAPASAVARVAFLIGLSWFCFEWVHQGMHVDTGNLHACPKAAKARLLWGRFVADRIRWCTTCVIFDRALGAPRP